MLLPLEMLIVMSLACWRISSLIVREAGPGDIFMRLRTWAYPHRILSGLVSCVWCVSIWVATLLILLSLTQFWWLMLPFTVSALAIGFDLVYTRNQEREGH